ncbi:response regulator [Paenibacillus sp. YN15]|uniref:response regulator n=1 Tax=Paenibacillus sp. YN15 TaxID=1742774 RepID=UPI000DCCD883|nr:response regulator [Paenibacillus sp. YN15]RAU99814.1 response regulator [Paenibacillus sp. YN15]
MKRALIVDDTKSIRLLLTKALELKGYTIALAGNGPAAMELLESQPYDVIFLDIKMPGLSGKHVLSWMVQRGITAPVVVMTAFATVKSAVECTKLGAYAYLQKPFTVEKIHRLLEGLEPSRFSPAQEASLLLKAGHWEKALSLLSSALAASPANPEIYRLMGMAYQQSGQTEQAAKFQQTYEIMK